jgi:hypothetical protein
MLGVSTVCTDVQCTVGGAGDTFDRFASGDVSRAIRA